MDDIKLSGLIAESNRLYGVMNSYYNIYCKPDGPIVQALMGYGLIIEAPTEGSPLIPAITVEPPEAMDKALAEFFLVLMKEKRSNRSHEANLAAIGYASTDEAIADVPNMVLTPRLKILTTNLTHSRELFVIVDACSFGRTRLQFVNDIAAVRNKLFEITRDMGLV